MFNFFKNKNYDDTLIVVGGVVLIAIAVHYFGEIINYVVDQSWFRFDPVLSIVLFFMAYRFARSLKQQNTIIEQQAKILDRIDRQIKNTFTKNKK